MKNLLLKGKKDISLLLIRLFFALVMMFSHGLPKLLHYSEQSESFADPFGIGSDMSLILTVIAEFFCSLALFFGVFTRVVLVPLMVTMITAAFVIHADDPFGKKEFALLYLVPFLAIFIAGPGKYSVDHWLFKR